MQHFMIFILCIVFAILGTGLTNDFFWKFGILRQADLKDAGIVGLLLFITIELIIYF